MADISDIDYFLKDWNCHRAMLYLMTVWNSKLIAKKKEKDFGLYIGSIHVAHTIAIT